MTRNDRRRIRHHVHRHHSPKPTSRRDGFCTSARLVLEKFSAYTSLHGFIFIAKHDLPVAKRLFWIVVLINVFVMCTFQTCSLIRFWNEGNILVTKESASIMVWDIPFPAITVCGENQVNKLRFGSALNELGDENFARLRNFTDILCDGPIHADTHTGSDTVDDNIVKYLFTKLTLSCEKTIMRVFWMQDELSDPCQYIQPIILSTGVCYSLNMVSHENLFDKEYTKILHNVLGYNKLMNFTFGLPWRVAGDTMFNSVTIALNLNDKNFEQYCEITGDGLKIFVHNPNEHPLQSSNLFVTGASSSLLLITPKSVTTSNSLLSWSTVSRGCFYQAEKALRYFKIYTQSNCELECRINKTTQRCGCAPFYLPRSKGIPVCGPTKQKCVRDAIGTKFSIFDPRGRVNDAHEKYARDRDCSCLPSCSELRYSTEISQTAINWAHIQKIISSNITDKFQNVALLTIQFKKKSVDNWVRSPVIRFNELVANVGGIVSLYIGCSIISFFEIICFAVMKKWLETRPNRMKEFKNCEQGPGLPSVLQLSSSVAKIYKGCTEARRGRG